MDKKSGSRFGHKKWVTLWSHFLVQILSKWGRAENRLAPEGGPTLVQNIF